MTWVPAGIGCLSKAFRGTDVVSEIDQWRTVVSVTIPMTESETQVQKTMSSLLASVAGSANELYSQRELHVLPPTVAPHVLLLIAAMSSRHFTLSSLLALHFTR